MNSRSDASPDQIERELAETRLEISQTLDAIQGKFSPVRMFTSAFGSARGAAVGAARGVQDLGEDFAGASGEFARNLGRTVRDSPMPIMLLGVGLGWLMWSSRHRDSRHGDGRFYRGGTPPDGQYGEDPYLSTGRTGYADLDDISPEPRFYSGTSASAVRGGGGAGKVDTGRKGSKIGESAQELGERVKGAAHRAAERTSGVAESAAETAGQISEAASQAAGTVREKLSHTGAVTRERLSDASETARMYAAQTRRRVTKIGQGAADFTEQNPFLVAIGLFAAGAALAAALPHTRREDELMGKQADAAKDRMRNVASDTYESVKERARAVGDEVLEAMESEGLTPDQLKAEAEEKMRGMGAVADKASEAVRRESERSISQLGGTGSQSDKPAGEDEHANRGAHG